MKIWDLYLISCLFILFATNDQRLTRMKNATAVQGLELQWVIRSSDDFPETSWPYVPNMLWRRTSGYIIWYNNRRFILPKTRMKSPAFVEWKHRSIEDSISTERLARFLCSNWIIHAILHRDWDCICGAWIKHILF